MNPEGPIGDAFQALDPPSFVTICQIIVSNTEAHYCLQIEHVSEVKGALSLYASGGGGDDAAAVLGRATPKGKIACAERKHNKNEYMNMYGMLHMTWQPLLSSQHCVVILSAFAHRMF